MSFWGVFGAVAAVGAVAAAGVYIFNKMSQAEIRKQERLHERYREYEREVKREYNYIRSEYENKWKKMTEEAAERLKQERQRIRAENIEKFRSIYDEYKAIICEQRTSKAEFLDQCRSALSEYKEFSEHNSQTYVRMNSLKSIILTLEEAIYKLESYLCYLDKYEKNLDKYFNEDGKIIEPFSMTLPEYWPYPGKIFHVKKNEIINFSYKPENGINLNFRYPSDRKLMESFDDNDDIPLMVLVPNQAGEIPGAVSIGSGMLKESFGSLSGISAKVLEVRGTSLLLDCFGKRIAMSEYELSRKRSITSGTVLNLYVKDYDFALKDRVWLTERRENSANLMFFDRVVIAYSREEYAEMKRFLESNNFTELDDEWNIGPVYDDDNSLVGLKVQISRYYGMLVSVAEKKGEDGTVKGRYFRFERMLAPDEMMTFSDVFAAVDVSLAACLVETVNNSDSPEIDEMFRNCEELLFYLSAEFCKQERLVSDSRMALYFKQWQILTDRLANELKKSERVVLKVESWQNNSVGKRQYTIIAARNAKKVLSFMRKAEKHKVSNRFFAEITDENGNTKPLPCKGIEYEDGTILFRINTFLSEEILLHNNFEFPVYALTVPYVELQQIQGFDDFRMNDVSSSEIKEIILSLSSLEYTDNGNRISELYNSDILRNEAQLNAVSRAFSSKDYFMIQGPPGTGKTTVIRELIMQQLRLDESSRILVVSQANVAVDNVLKGLSSFGGLVEDNRIVRCGSDDKIADDIKIYSYSGQLNRYCSELQKPCAVPELRQRWMDILESENESFVGECLMRTFQIVGATCLGLSNRKLGLQGMEFDLVIIDEAGKALPGELIIPINRAKKLVIIGDHKQLPPVVDPHYFKGGDVRTDDVIDEPTDFFNKSFFERLWNDCPDTNKVMLDTQYRMPLSIAGLVNIFYDGKLKSGYNCALKKPIVFGHNLVLLDMKDNPEYVEQQEENSGPYNCCEAESAAVLCKKLRREYSGRIVIITPYKNQKRHIWNEIKKQGLKDISVNTVDAFQGDEEDIVIFCTTRSKKPTEYFSFSSRLNVAFSRAKHNLIIIASSDYFLHYQSDKPIRKVYEYIKSYGKIIPFNSIDSDDFDMQFDCEKTETDIKQQELPAQPDISFAAKIDKICSQTKPIPKRFCQECYTVLKDYEEVLCSNCIQKTVSVNCQCCGLEIRYSLMDKYFAKKPTPQLCNECDSYKCSCGNEFFAPKAKYSEISNKGRRMYCKDCNRKRNEVVKSVPCSACGGLIQYTFGMIQDSENSGYKLPTMCKTCREMQNREYEKMQCEVCGKMFSFTFRDKQYYDKKRMPYPHYCKECLSKVCETTWCISCHNKIEYTYKDKHWFESQNRQLPRHCQDCADRVYVKLNCCDCGKRFDYTYGQLQYNSDRGFEAPKRCEMCRLLRKHR